MAGVRYLVEIRPTLYIVSLSLGPCSALGEKKKQNIDERSEPAGSMGRKRVALSPFPDNRSAHFARRYSYFSYFTPVFLAFFHYCGALSQAKFLLMINST